MQLFETPKVYLANGRLRSDECEKKFFFSLEVQYENLCDDTMLLWKLQWCVDDEGTSTGTDLIA